MRPLGNMPVLVVRPKASMVLLRYMFTQRRQKPASERRRKGFGEGKGILVGEDEMIELLTEDENNGVEVFMWDSRGSGKENALDVFESGDMFGRT